MPAKSLRRVSGKGVYSHVFNSGIEGKSIFADAQDCETFLGYLEEYLSPPPDPKSVKKKFTVKGRTYTGAPHQPKNYHNKVELIAYGISSTHFHLVLHQITAKSQSRFLRSLCTRYSIYFNKKHKRTGPLFDGPYKSYEISDLADLGHFTCYVHIQNKAEPKLAQYSSLPEYLGVRNTSWVKAGVVLKKLPTYYKDFIAKYDSEQGTNILLNILGHKKPINQTSEDTTSKPLERTENSDKKDESFKEVPSPRKHSSNVGTQEYIASSVFMFAILFAVGLNNVKVSIAEAETEALYASSPSSIVSPEVFPMVAGAEDEIVNLVYSATDLAENEDILKDIDPQIASILEDIVTPQEPIKVVVIKTLDGASNVNLRSAPTTDSEKIGFAKDADVFELVSDSVSGWYQVKLPDGNLAFVSADFAHIESEENI